MQRARRGEQNQQKKNRHNPESRAGERIHTDLTCLASGKRESSERVAPQRKKKKGATEGNENGKQRLGSGGRGHMPATENGPAGQEIQ